MGSGVSASRTPAGAQMAGTWRAVDIKSWQLDDVRYGKSETTLREQFPTFERICAEDGKHHWQ